MELFLKTLGSNIRKYRQSMNLTLEQLAEILAISPSYLGLVERGKRKISIDKLWSIVQVLGIDISSLFPEEVPHGQDTDPMRALLNGLSEKDRGYIYDMILVYRKHIKEE